jgi:asparagine synthase (glutamine-hydrolysing)
VESIDTHGPLVQQRVTYAECGDAALVNRMLAYDWKYTLADNDLPKVVGTTSLAGVGVRFPLLADEIVDFSLALRPELKLKGLKLRYFFKEALRGFLPDEIIAKKKHGFGLPFGIWLTQDKGLRTYVTDALGQLEGRGIVRREFARTLLDVRVAEHPGYYGEMVWILMMLSEWLRARAQAVTATPVSLSS